MLKFKIVFLGDQSVGKTSIINRFIYDNFSGSEQPTVGIDFISKTLQINQKSIRLQLWDTAGQERFRSLIPSYIRDCQVAIICYDITNSKSFENLQRWIDDVREERGDEVFVYVLGNKSDLQDNRQVDSSIVQTLANDQQFLFYEVSAKDGTNVFNVFDTISRQLTQEPSNNQIAQDVQSKPNQKISLDNKSPQQTSQDTTNNKCC